jgi:hypothetical protein
MTGRFIRARIATLLVQGAVVLGMASPAAGDDPTQLLLGMEAAYARVERYTALFVRQEVVSGVARPREEALVKWKRPGLLYLRCFATIVMAPDSPRVLEESRRPVTDVGIGRLIDRVLSYTRRAAQAGELTVDDHGIARGPGGLERRLEAVFPRDREPGYAGHRLVLMLAADSGAPREGDRPRQGRWRDRRLRLS